MRLFSRATLLAALLLVIVSLALPSWGVISAQTPSVEKRCGVQVTDLPISGDFWATQGSKKTIDPQVDKFITPVHVVPDSGDGGPSSYQLSSDGRTLAYFRVKVDRSIFSYFSGYFRSVEIIQPDGNILQLPAQDGWWELGPELSPGHFGILAYDSEFAADVLDLSYVDGKLTLSKFEDLSFTINVAAVTRDKPVHISQDWQYLAYVSVPTATFNFSLYSRSQNRTVGQIPLYKGELASIYWGIASPESKSVAWVNLGGRDGNGTLLEITEIGQIRYQHDLSKILSEDIRIFGGTSQVSPDGYLALWLQTLVSDRLLDKGLYLLDVNSGKLIDLCISDKTLLGFPSFLWADDGKYLLAQRFDGFNAVPLEMMIIDVATGNYSLQYLADDGQALYLVAWSKAQQSSQSK